MHIRVGNTNTHHLQLSSVCFLALFASKSLAAVLPSIQCSPVVNRNDMSMHFRGEEKGDEENQDGGNGINVAMRQQQSPPHSTGDRANSI